MYTPAIIFLCAVVFCIGAAVGGLIEHALRKGKSPSPLFPSPQNSLAEEGDLEVFSAWRRPDSTIWLEMDGQRTDNKEALLPEQRQRLLGLLLDLRPWLEPTRDDSSKPTATTPPDRPVIPVPVVPLQPVQANNKKTAPAEETIKPALAQESIIEQINTILQAKLATSALKDRGIGLTEGPGGIVIIQDGPNRYEGLDAIPDPQLKSLIQQAVADWEKAAL